MFNEKYVHAENIGGDTMQFQGKRSNIFIIQVNFGYHCVQLIMVRMD